MREFPKALYRAGTGTLVDGVECAFMLAKDAAEQAVALADGWGFVAHAEPASPASQSASPADDAPPTRAELEAKATELGVRFDGRWGDKRLSDAIAAKLKD